MNNRSMGVILTLAIAVAAQADPLKHSLLDGVFKPAQDAMGEGAVHPLPPAQKLKTLENNTFRIVGEDAEHPLAFPVLAKPEGGSPADLKALEGAEPAFIAAVDLTGTGASDLIYTTQAMNGWGVLSNGLRLPKPVQAFVAGYFPKDAAAAKAEVIPADNRDFAVDQNLLAAVGDFLGNGTEQLAYARPGSSMIFIVGAHGVTTMKADLSKVQPCPSEARSHWLFPYKSHRKGQHTRLAYYRAGANHLIRLVPKGMEFVSEQVPLKGHWERLNQNVLDWPVPAPAAASAAAPAAAAQTAAAPATTPPPAAEKDEKTPQAK